MERPVIVLGMQRSGTSALAGALSRLGIFLGDESGFFTSDANNREGYYELKSLTNFNHKCLSVFQMHVGSVRRMPLNWEAHPMAPLLVGELRHLLTKTFQGRPIWGLKQPITGLVWPIYETAFRLMECDPVLVLCVRNPIEVMRSEENWQYVSGGRQIAPLGDRAIGAWLRHTLGALEIAGERPLTIVPYDSLLRHPRDYLSRIVSSVDGCQPNERQWLDALESIKPSMKRQSEPVEELAEYPDLVLSTYAYVASKGRDVAEEQLLVEEFRTWLEIMAPQPPSGTRVGIAWFRGGDVQSIQVPFMPCGDWQTLKVDIGALPASEVQALMYNRPCRVWIRQCTFTGPHGTFNAKFLAGPGSQLTDFGGIIRLDGAYEARQITLRTPSEEGPFTFELEFWLESSPSIVNDAAIRIATRLEECVVRTSAWERQRGGPARR
ncbi:MAG: hypothetical protein P4L46_06760 [Fimbriimonas sp.]|nr:hypothetical protein [Fimbriimonas sp.]